jgi:hypothetical protein
MKTLELSVNNFEEFGNIIEVDDRFCMARGSVHFLPSILIDNTLLPRYEFPQDFCLFDNHPFYFDD